MTRRRRDRVRRARNLLVRLWSRERGNYYYDGAASVRGFLADGYGRRDVVEMARVERRRRPMTAQLRLELFDAP